MIKAKPLSSFWSKLIVILLILNALIFISIIISSSVSIQVQYIPDDAFYYLTMAKNFATLGEWTFDSGTSVTSGFHPLFAYILVFIYRFTNNDINAFLNGSVLISSFFALATIIILFIWGSRQNNVLFLIFFSLFISSENFLLNIVSVTEWSLVIFFSSLYMLWFHHKFLKKNKLLDFGIIFILGLLGSLARSDFGLFSFALFVSAFILIITRLQKKSVMLLPSFGLLGSIVGIIVLFIHNFIFTGDFLQSSARMKSFWATFDPPSYLNILQIIGQLISLSGSLLLIFLLSASIFPKFSKTKEKNNNLRKNQNAIRFGNIIFTQEFRSLHSGSDIQKKFVLFLGAALCTVGYVVFYSRNAAIQPWYTANFFVPFLIIFFGISNYIVKNIKPNILGIVPYIFTFGLIFNLVAFYPVSSSNAPWPHQKFMLDAGTYLRSNFTGSNIGAWNAGIIGYYAGGHIINLDGLVNNDIYVYAINNQLPDYISSADIQYIVDFERMFAEKRSRRGGYQDEDFLANLHSIKVFDDSDHYWNKLTLYKLHN